MSPDTKDDKYEKALQQNRNDKVVIFLGFLLCCLFALVYHFHNDLSSSPLKTTVSDTASTITIPIGELEQKVQTFDRAVRDLKAQIPIFESNADAQTAAIQLQEATRLLLAARYGAREPYHVKVMLEFQPSIPNFDNEGSSGEFTIEMAPTTLLPHSVFTFLEIARQWKSGAFHRIAGHVLQVMVRTKTNIQHLAFQEYSPLYPHKKMTCGYAGRPSGPAFYVSILDNSKNHGPGSQQKENPYEADSNFGTVIQGFDETVMRITKVPGTGFLQDPKLHVLIKEMIIMIPNELGIYEEWKEHSRETAGE
jgi:hypothetical protein